MNWYWKACHINSRANVMILLFTRQWSILVNTQVHSHALLHRGFGTSVPFITVEFNNSRTLLTPFFVFLYTESFLYRHIVKLNYFTLSPRLFTLHKWPKECYFSCASKQNASYCEVVTNVASSKLPRHSCCKIPRAWTADIHPQIIPHIANERYLNHHICTCPLEATVL